MTFSNPDRCLYRGMVQLTTRNGGLENLRAKDASAVSLELLLNATWTNATFEAALCTAITELGPNDLAELRIEVKQGAQVGLLMVPDCFWTLTALTEVALHHLILTGSTESGAIEADPIARLPATLRTISIYNSRLLNPSDGGSTYKPRWTDVFASKPQMSILTLIDVGIEGEMPDVIFSKVQTITVTQNPLLTGSIPSSLLLNYSMIENGISVNFSSNGLTGSIPADLFSNYNGTRVYNFDFSRNALSGSLPSALLDNLRWENTNYAVIDLSSNEFDGELPQLFGSNFWNVSSIDLRLNDNKLSGIIPGSLFAATGTLSTVLLDLSGNDLSGTIPNLFAQTNSSLNIVTLGIFLGRNQLTGAIPSSNLWPPRHLNNIHLNWDLSENSISGAVPVDLLANVTSATSITLDFSGNALTGTINPSMIADAEFDNLGGVTLSFANNNINGPLTADLIGSASQNIYGFELDLSSNPLGGTIPNDLLSAYNIDSSIATGSLVVNLANCNLSGTLPALSAKVHYLTINLNENFINAIANNTWSDYLSDALLSISTAFSLSVVNNNLTGDLSLPDHTSQFPGASLNFSGNNLTTLAFDANIAYLQNLNVANNARLTGSLPARLFDVSSYMQTFIATSTSLSGPFPNLSGIQNSQLLVLDINDTKVDSCPPSWTSAWIAPQLITCGLRNTNASNCIAFFPKRCQEDYIVEPVPSVSPVSPPTTEPETSPAPSASSPTASPSTATSPVVIPVAVSPTSTPSGSTTIGWSPQSTICVVLMLALFLGY